jgi:hypothetical protein
MRNLGLMQIWDKSQSNQLLLYLNWQIARKTTAKQSKNCLYGILYAYFVPLWHSTCSNF